MPGKSKRGNAKFPGTRRNTPSRATPIWENDRRPGMGIREGGRNPGQAGTRGRACPKQKQLMKCRTGAPSYRRKNCAPRKTTRPAAADHRRRHRTGAGLSRLAILHRHQPPLELRWSPQLHPAVRHAHARGLRCGDESADSQINELRDGGIRLDWLKPKAMNRPEEHGTAHRRN